MTPQQRTILRNYALATLGAGAVAVSLYFGGFDSELNRPTPITVDGETIEFTWTDDNTNEDLLIYTDQRDYENGFSHATVYAAVTNQSGVDQDVSLMGSFVNERRKIKDVSVLTTATFAATSTEIGTCRDLTGAQIQNQIRQGADVSQYRITEYSPTTTPRTFEVCDKSEVVTYSTSTEWVALPQTKRDIYEVAIEEGYLDKLSRIRKSVDGYVAENKTLHFPIKDGQTLYYKLEIEYPANDTGNFFLEAIGSEGAYGHLDPWFDASWDYRLALEINPSYVSGSSNLTSFPVYVDLADLPSDFHTNVKSDGCDIRIVESDETTETAFEIVDYDATGDTGELHFLADSISYNATTTFYVYYGNSGASCYGVTDTYGRNNTWTDYVAVWHLEESSGNRVDATGNGNTMTANNAPGSGTGKMGDGVSMNGSNQTLDAGTAPAGFNGFTDVSFSAWVNQDTTGTRGIFCKYAGNADSGAEWLFSIDAGTNLGTHIKDTAGSGFDEHNTSYTFNTSTWYHTYFILDGTNTNFYHGVNGSIEGTYLTSASGIQDGDSELVIGGLRTNAWYFDGIIDEVRAREFVASADWIATEYNNQNAPEPFYWVGDQETNAGDARRIIRTTQPI